MSRMSEIYNSRGRTPKIKLNNYIKKVNIEELKGVILAQIEIIEDEYQHGYSMSYKERMDLLRIQNELNS